MQDDGRGDDVRQYGMGVTISAHRLKIGSIMQIRSNTRKRSITEFDDLYNFDHVETPGPYGYKIVQEKGSGIISAQSVEWLMGGRSNAWDGWCLIPDPAQKIHKETPSMQPIQRYLATSATLAGKCGGHLD